MRAAGPAGLAAPNSRAGIRRWPALAAGPGQGGGGSLIDMGGHCIDLLEMFFGPVRQVSCFVRHGARRTPPRTRAVATLQFASGALGVVDTFFCIPDQAARTAWSCTVPRAASWPAAPSAKADRRDDRLPGMTPAPMTPSSRAPARACRSIPNRGTCTAPNRGVQPSPARGPAEPAQRETLTVQPTDKVQLVIKMAHYGPGHRHRPVNVPRRKPPCNFSRVPTIGDGATGRTIAGHRSQTMLKYGLYAQRIHERRIERCRSRVTFAGLPDVLRVIAA